MADIRSGFRTISLYAKMQLKVKDDLLVRLPLGLLWVAGAALGLA